jgi:hypothetical protein
MLHAFGFKQQGVLALAGAHFALHSPHACAGLYVINFIAVH